MVISLAGSERLRDRAPKPEIQLNLLGTLAATSLALLAYLGALLGHLSLPSGFAIVLLAIAPSCAIPATVLMAIRARAEQDEALRAVTAGLAVACVGMVLQLMAFRVDRVRAAGFSAPQTAGTALIYLLWHLALPAGALAADRRASPTHAGGVGVAIGIGILALLFATGSARLVDAGAKPTAATRSACVLALDRRASSSPSGSPSDAGCGATACGRRPPAAGSRSRWFSPSTTWTLNVLGHQPLQLHLVGEPRHPGRRRLRCCWAGCWCTRQSSCSASSATRPPSWTGRRARSIAGLR